MRRSSYSYLLGIVFLLALEGCARYKLVPVRGRLLIDGAPVRGVEVTFMPEDEQTAGNAHPRAYGQTDTDGHFTLATAGQPGAVIGNYRVIISKLHIEILPERRSIQDQLMPSEYVNQETTP